MSSLPWHLPKHKKLKVVLVHLYNGRFDTPKTSRRYATLKRYGNLYEKIYDIDNLKLAHRNARKDKLYYREVKMVDADEEYYLLQIQEMLKNKTYVVGEYIISIINDKGKERELCKLPYYPDRIIQWAILLQIEFVFMSVLTNFTCASLRNRGIHKASAILDKYMKNKTDTQYCLKIDISKFYPNINHNIIKQMLRKKFKDNDLLELLDKIIDSTDGEKGIPIGSYLSQFLANFYLAYFDHWLKETIKCKYVIRYMDDIVILNRSKYYLHCLKLKMDKYLWNELQLKIKDNWQVFPTNIRGIDFVGYRHFYNYKLLRKTTYKRFKKKMTLMKKKYVEGERLTYSEWCSVNSYKGWLKWCDSYRLAQKYITPIQEYVNEYYIKEIKERNVA